MFSTSHICTYTPEDEVTNSNHVVKIYKHILELYDEVLTIFVKFSAHVSAQLQHAFRLKRLTKKGIWNSFSYRWISPFHISSSSKRPPKYLFLFTFLSLCFFLLVRTTAYAHHTSVASILLSIL